LKTQRSRYVSGGPEILDEEMVIMTERREIASHLAALAAALRARNLKITVQGGDCITVRNPAGDPDESDLQGQAMSPGLSQKIAYQPHGADGGLWWFWAWSGPERDSPPELEPLCPIGDTETLADRIARVLAVPFDVADS
jgi:hypothetical protein